MANNPKKVTVFNQVTDAQLATLAGNGTVTKGSDTLTADEGAAYLTADTSVSYKAQTLTSTEKAQARTNIGAGTSNFSGSYNDLSDKPTIPTVNDATLTIQKNGATVDTFTANASSNKTINITVPTSASDVGALSSSTKYGKSLSVSGTSLSLKDQDGTVLSTVTTQDTTYSSKSASSGGTDVSLVTTGEKYTWNSKSTFSGNYNDLTNKPTILSSNEILNLVYPVGSIYITVGTGTTGSTSPASFLGGTWTRLPEGYALWTASSGAYNGSTGTISAGLPNISGTIENRQYGSSDNSGALFLPTGVISYDIKGGTQTYGTTYNVANYSRKTSLLTIDASQSGADAIYGKSSTVQPPAIKIYGWRRTA